MFHALLQDSMRREILKTFWLYRQWPLGATQGLKGWSQQVVANDEKCSTQHGRQAEALAAGRFGTSCLGAAGPAGKRGRARTGSWLRRLGSEICMMDGSFSFFWQALAQQQPNLGGGEAVRGRRQPSVHAPVLLSPSFACFHPFQPSMNELALAVVELRGASCSSDRLRYARPWARLCDATQHLYLYAGTYDIYIYIWIRFLIYIYCNEGTNEWMHQLWMFCVLNQQSKPPARRYWHECCCSRSPFGTYRYR